MTQTQTSDSTPVRHVSSLIEATISTPARVVLQIAAADGPPRVSESLTVTLDGNPCDVEEVALGSGARTHVLHTQPGSLVVRYEASIGTTTAHRDVTEADRLIYGRPSRYSESDKLGPLAMTQLPSVADNDPLDVLRAVTAFVGTRTAYVVGASRVTDGAVETFLAGAGVCRDFVHLSVGLLRALGVPARAVAVYAPGLYPMDFHAVTEVAIDDRWQIVDTTLLAPRQSLVRIATGRDAADNAFLDLPYGQIKVTRQEVTAVVDPTLPVDDVTQPVWLA